MSEMPDGYVEPNHMPGRHVWVTIPGTTRRCPGVILDWRVEGNDWAALVTYADGGGIAPVRAVTGWMPAQYVTDL